MKKRYSIPAKLIDLLFADDAFFNEVSKIKKAPTNGSFPKTDQWSDDSGFNMFFALAGYSPEDLTINIYKDTVEIKSAGIEEEEKYIPTIPSESADALDLYKKDVNQIIHTGYILRGIARRSFSVKYIISEEFDTSRSEAYMQDGLLHIFIPAADLSLNAAKIINIKKERKQ